MAVLSLAACGNNQSKKAAEEAVETETVDACCDDETKACCDGEECDGECEGTCEEVAE